MSTGIIDTGFTSVHILLGLLITPTNSNFIDYIFTDFFTSFSIISDNPNDTGLINILQSMFNFSNNTSYIIFDKIIEIPMFLRDGFQVDLESEIGQGFTVPADGNSYISLVISSNWNPTTSFKFAGSIQYRGVFMND